MIEFSLRSKFIKCVCVTVLIAVLGGCQSLFSSYVQISSNQYPKTSSGDVEVYVTKLPPHDYEELGFISWPISRGAEHSSVLPMVKSIAAKNGGNAVIKVELHGNYLTGVAVRWK